MKKDDFLRQLEYLLQDIPEEEKRDAIDYYRDYLEEAGPEREEEVLNGFGGPERLAAMIRTELNGGMESAGEFTDQGFEDQRFAASACPPAPSRGDAQSRGSFADGERTGRGGETADGGRSCAGARGAYEKGSYARRRAGGYHSPDGKNSGADAETGAKKSAGSSWWKYLLIGLGILIISPFALAAAFGLAGGVFGLIGTLFGVFLALALLTLAAFIGGISLIVAGIFQLFPNFWVGLMLVGLGLAALGIGCLLFFCSGLFYGIFLPWLVKSVVGLFRKTGKKEDRPGGQPG